MLCSGKLSKSLVKILFIILLLILIKHGHEMILRENNIYCY